MLKTFFLNSTLANYGEEEFNYIQKFLLQQGILNTQGADYNDFIDYKVTQHGAGNMSVDVATGVAVINTIRNSVSFKVFVANQASANLPVTANALGTNRVDAVILKLSRVTEPDALMSNVSSLVVVPGTGVSALSDNAIQTAIGANFDFIRLANLTVANGATQILTAGIADTRVRCYSTDATVPNPTIIKFRQLASDPATPAEGEMWYNTTANVLKYYDGASTILIQASTYTGGNGINVTAGVVSVALVASLPGLEFNGGLLRVKAGSSAGDVPQLETGGKYPSADGTQIKFSIVASANIKATANTSRNVTNIGSYTKYKEVAIPAGYGTGTVRANFRRTWSSGNNIYTAIYVNGVLVPATASSGSADVDLTYDVTAKGGDLIQLYSYNGSGSGSGTVSNFTVGYDHSLLVAGNGTINLD